ncbi:MAG TPA: hypothetical protein PKD32_10680 [Saprospiraceae bacterium]|nr:hypothetical protein [Saprospiraceae bacterium]
MRSVSIFFFVSLWASVAIAQSSAGGWMSLSRVAYKKEYDPVLGIKVDRPIFAPEIKALAGKEITLKGYIIPTDGFKSHSEFVFSAFPYSSCFFCGQAGPETVIEVKCSTPIQYTSESITIKGILSLNDSDINRLMFSLRNATKVN